MTADFLDTNVFIYAFDQAEPRKRDIAREIIADAIERGTGHISHQVVQETLRVLTEKARPRLDPGATSRFLDEVLIPLWDILPRPSLYQRALQIRARHGYSFYDSLIIAAAIEAGCDRIVSEDLQHGQRIEGLVIEDPFRV
ncbi:MAG: PIN domain-containing protein [Chloroflexi bacterium]|nr:PIN domain-containing protein [Chloroflexota bacterium]